MPTVDVNLKDLEKLIGRKLPKDLDDLFMYVKGEVDAKEGNDVKLDIKDTNRADLWSAEGIARELKAKLGYDRGLVKYKLKKGKVSVTIDKNLEDTRPLIACGIARNVKVTDDFIVQMVQLQEKVGITLGRKRKEAGIGLYDFDTMKPPVYYKGYKDKEIEYIPLDWKVKMRPSEILIEHQKGREFAHLLKDTEYYPIVIDSAGEVSSMPPIINSEHSGRITEKTKNIFIESTGYNWETINIALKIIMMALADRGAVLEPCLIKFPKGKIYPKKDTWTPFFGTKKITIEPEYFRKRSGLNLKDSEIVKLLERARYKISKKGKKLVCEYGDYRNDILHQADILEDMLISYGYNNIEPEEIKMAVKGSEVPERRTEDIYREICVGLGLQEVLTFTMTSREKQGAMILLPNEVFVEIANYVSLSWQLFRKRIFPELLEFLAKNKNQVYPQRIFEIGKTLELSAKQETGVREHNKLCIVMAHAKTNFTEIKSALDAVARNRGFEYNVKESGLVFLEKGKGADVIVNGKTIGFAGELNSKALGNFGLETKVCVLEIEV